MIDFVLGLALAAMLVRGWTRGFVRESLDLVGLVLGLWIAFRLSVPLATFLGDSFGVGPEAARIGGGILLFVLFGVLLAVAAHYLSRMMDLPGLSTVNRVGGAAVAVGWGAVIVLVLVSLIASLPIPGGWRAQLDDSRVVQTIAGEEAVPRRLFESMAGDNVMAAIASLRQVFGAARGVPEEDQVLEAPPARRDEVRQVRTEADMLLGRINEDRLSAGLSAVRSNEVLTALAEDHAVFLYTSGQVRRILDCVARLAERAHPVLRCDNGVALAATAVAAYEGIFESTTGEAMIEAPSYDRAGVAVVEGPTGRMVVVLLAS